VSLLFTTSHRRSEGEVRVRVSLVDDAATARHLVGRDVLDGFLLRGKAKVSGCGDVLNGALRTLSVSNAAFGQSARE